MRTFEPVMQEQIDVFLRQLLCDHSQRKVSNMSRLCERLAVDIIAQLAFGYPLNTLTDPEHRVVIESLRNRSRRATLYYFWPRLKALDKVFDFLGNDGSISGLRR